MNNPDNPCDQAEFECTQKCIEALSEGANSELETRARQFCLLLVRDDSVSLNLREKVKSKVDLNHLIDEGYVKPKSFNPNSTSHLMSTAPTVAMNLEHMTSHHVNPANRSIIKSDLTADINALT